MKIAQHLQVDEFLGWLKPLPSIYINIMLNNKIRPNDYMSTIGQEVYEHTFYSTCTVENISLVKNDVWLFDLG